jgi:uncharacterized protein (DUF2235 family)
MLIDRTTTELIEQPRTKATSNRAEQFARIVSANRIVPIKFIGVWDTVASAIVARPYRFYLPSLQTLPYTRRAPSVEVFRHAMAIDEQRRMFRVSP